MAEAKQQGAVSDFLDWVFQKPNPAIPVPAPEPATKIQKKGNKSTHAVKTVGLVAVVIVGTAVVAKHFGVDKDKVKSWLRNVRSFDFKKLLPGKKSDKTEGDAPAA